MKNTPQKNPIRFAQEKFAPGVGVYSRDGHPRLGRVRCLRVSEVTHPNFEEGRFYDLFDIRCYGAYTFFRAGVEGVFEADSFADDFEVVEIQPDAHAQLSA